MAGSYIVCPMEKRTDYYCVDYATLVGSLAKRWPGAQVRTRPEDYGQGGCAWSVTLGREEYGCVVRPPHHSLSIEPHRGEGVAVMAVWFRSLVPPEYRLGLFYPDAWPKWLDLTIETTEQDALDFVEGRAPGSPRLDFM